MPILKNFLRRKNDNLKLEDLTDKGLLTKEEILFIKKERAIKIWEDEFKRKNQPRKFGRHK